MSTQVNYIDFKWQNADIVTWMRSAKLRLRKWSQTANDGGVEDEENQSKWSSGKSKKKEEWCAAFREELRQGLGAQEGLPKDWTATANVIMVLGVSSELSRSGDFVRMWRSSEVWKMTLKGENTREEGDAAQGEGVDWAEGHQGTQ